MALGLEKGVRISIMAPTNPIWDWCDYGGRAAGCSVNTLYPDDTSETIIYTTNHSGVKCICVQNQDLLEKILKVWDDLPPVSYTHLDVYKRQLLYCGSGNPTALRYAAFLPFKVYWRLPRDSLP